MKYNKRSYIKKFNILNVAITAMFIGIICYAFYVQILNNSNYKNEVSLSAIKQRKLAAPRGRILDSNGIVLAYNEYKNDLYIIPHYFQGNIDTICGIVKIDCRAIKQKIQATPLNRVLIVQHVSDDIAHSVIGISGLFIQSYPQRVYNSDVSIQHVIGYVGLINRSTLEVENNDGIYAYDDIVGKSGIEYVYDRQMHGINGAEKYVVMANGLELLSPNRFLSKGEIIIKPKQSNDLILSIDHKIQDVFAKEMAGKKGAAVMMDIHTGAIIGLYSGPGFDPNDVRAVFNSNDYPLINRAISGYAPGSTFKIVTALAALELGIITIDDKFDCPGYYVFGGRVYHCWKHGAEGGHGKINLRDAIKHSCDVYFYNLAQKVGLENIVKYAKLLGFGSNTGIDLNDERAGMIVGRIKYKGAVINTVIGQGEVLVSPIQLANAYSSIFNGGILYLPRVVKGELVVLQKNSFKPENIEILRDALWAVVNEEGGTGFQFKSKTIILAGKTGTSQKADLHKINVKDNAVFVGFYPVSNPKIVICIFIEDGKHGSNLIPIANAVIEEYIKYY